MNIAQTIPMADSWGMHGDGSGWWIVGAAVMMLFMGAMMWMMMRGMGGSSPPASSAPLDRFVSRESPAETLERRFAEGAISAEEYRARREVLASGTAQANGAHNEAPLTAPREGEGKP